MNKKRENMIVVSEDNDKIEEVEYNERQQQLLTRSEPFCLNFKSSSKVVDDTFLMSEVSYGGGGSTPKNPKNPKLV